MEGTEVEVATDGTVPSARCKAASVSNKPPATPAAAGSGADAGAADVAKDKGGASAGASADGVGACVGE
jgi:hypothetical protein